MKKPYEMSKEEVFLSLETDAGGLTSAEAAERLPKSGPNELTADKKRPMFLKFIDQFKDVMIIVLLAAAIVSAAMAVYSGEYRDLIDSGLILLIVIVNAVIGLTQESKAESALEALKNINKPIAKVFRDGGIQKIKSGEIVPGDIVILEAGDIIPADMRLIESAALKIEEAALTGESVPSEKDADAEITSDAPLGDRRNMAYSSGIVSYGRGKGIVTSTGMNTEVGKIAKMLSENDSERTPLQNQLAKTAKLLSLLILGIAVIIFIFSAVQNGGNGIIDAFMTAVAIAVAAIPEGLPAVVTIVLALGVQKMSERNAIIRNLPAVETLGCCEIICSDKTGTLTLNKMTVQELYTVSGGAVAAEDGKTVSNAEFETLIRGMVLCNDTVAGDGGELYGDPTETALVAYARSAGRDTAVINAENPRVDEIPFDSVRKLMSTVNETEADGRVVRTAYIKGAPDMLIKRCAYISCGGKTQKITAEDVKNIGGANAAMARKALRVLAVAVKYECSDTAAAEEGITFIGLVGMIDPPRPEVREAVEVCKRAGMTAVMITGDHKETASAIAKEIGILEDGHTAITGAELDEMDDGEFYGKLDTIRVYARVSPENKVRIVRAFKNHQKRIVAMTGDGVNDAPSLKAADIGIGMGITGTDVSKGASDMVLADDNFATIVSAVEEGRKVYSNIKKAVQFLLSANIAEVLCLFITTIFMRVPFLTPVMILWVNMVTDSLPALALGMESAEKDIMSHPPRKNDSSLFHGRTGLDIAIQGMLQTALVLGVYCIGFYLIDHGDHAASVTMAFAALCLIQLFHSYNLRSQTKSVLNGRILKNKALNTAFLVGAALVVLVITVPGLNGIFDAVALNGVQWAVVIAMSFAIIPLVEVVKAVEKVVFKHRRTTG
ncbi:MAG: calcium-translocating P-type ATPase, PMCA-type [Clostridiales bacterium]|jgi:Ca2+-transporting ATPase|nr:calcium-translocating P-type ATPase, PMCA-type [Clostridiales bacterium]